jgi:hypothetical protein
MNFLLNLHIGWPQGLYLCLTALGLLVMAAQHGQNKKGKYDIVSSLIGTVLVFSLLIWGGFFN